MEVRHNPTTDNSSVTLRQQPSPSKQPKPSPNPVDTTSVSQRLQKELMSLMMSSGDLGVSAFPEGESIFAWIGTIEGGKGTIYEGLSYKLSLRFPLDYPFKPPQVKFETMCFHPNVDQFGNICLDILQDKWSSAYDCRTILLSIQSLLGEPNTESPLNSYAATLWKNKEVCGTQVVPLEWEPRTWPSLPIIATAFFSPHPTSPTHPRPLLPFLFRSTIIILTEAADIPIRPNRPNRIDSPHFGRMRDDEQTVGD
ncbi:hypothetical protein TEA_029774 [Camellia sinensis var. sinensis]|uniref:E2 ubiquitin-conjugating enzyme n=2 Tax=Camellia sinensis TaxID=4442 RepID=A0A4S4ELA4_CAMSN|nr:hypothetical protein TEA_029774 [Camellia sinensis var. sinensis]